MGRTAVIVLAVGCAIGGGLLGAMLAPPNAPAPAAGSESEDLARLRLQVRELTQSIEAMRSEARPAARRPHLPALGPTSPPTHRSSVGLQGIDVTPGSRRQGPTVAAKPTGTFKTKSTDALTKEALAMPRTREGREGAIRRYQALLTRDLKPEERRDILLALGESYRQTGEPKKATTVVEKLLDEAPTGSMHELAANLKLGALHYDAGAYRDALRAAEAVSRSPNAKSFQIVQARWMAVTSMIQLGDKAGAERELESMIADYTDQEGMDASVSQYKTKLEELRE